MRKMENFRAYKRMEEDETEEKRMNGDNSYKNINIAYCIELNYTN